MNRILRAVLIICIVGLVMFCASAIAEKSGYCGKDGDNLTWHLDDEGTLTISGTGQMANYELHEPIMNEGYYTYAPWGTLVIYHYRYPEVGLEGGYTTEHLVKRIIIEEGVTSIGNNAFACMGVEYIYIPASVTSIGLNAFALNGSEKITSDCSNYAYTYQYTYVWNRDATIIIEPLKGATAENHKTANIVVDSAIEPTCTETGLTEGSHFEGCNHINVAQEVVPALGHDPVVDIEAVDPTCTTDGNTEKTHCSRCGIELSESETIPALGHTGVVDQYVAPSCTADGLSAGYHCQTCGKVFVEQETIPALGHDWNNKSFIRDEDNQHVSLFRICSRDQSHAEIVDLNTTVLPDSLSAIWEEAFANTKVQAVIVPEECVSIGKKAFADCEDLLYVYIPSGVTEIAPDAFEECESVYIDQQ